MDREQALETALGQIERQFGKGSVMKMSDQAQVAISAVSTGSLSLDVALGVGGLPRGRVVEVYGPEAAGGGVAGGAGLGVLGPGAVGKNAARLPLIRGAAGRGGICAFIDAEHAM